MRRFRNYPQGFTRLELLAVLFGVSLVVVLAIGAGADNRGRSQKLVCIENLRQIGQAFELWRFEHGDTMPWHLETTNGGSRGITVGTAWIQQTFLSNSIVSPRVLVCPSDYRTLPHAATNWGSGAGGFQNSAYRNNAASYTVGLHTYLYAPRDYLSSDRNLSVDYINQGCGFASLSGVARIDYGGGTRTAWTNELHGLLGNVLLNDGSVGEKTAKQLVDIFRPRQSDAGDLLHLLIP